MSIGRAWAAIWEAKERSCKASGAQVTLSQVTILVKVLADTLGLMLLLMIIIFVQSRRVESDKVGGESRPAGETIVLNVSIQSMYCKISPWRISCIRWLAHREVPKFAAHL